ncbi:hypothetical protein ONE63_007360 [Megalurothrips usitatus]|uniref:Uncharacterized protein n=1 Tax=Megalurothrips usitatus TaxID=439358 RepID=A0AAV7XSW7_9NEOP|nr:hypothetical protein ONE63_007360 [Megalurothrips usitatus]
MSKNGGILSAELQWWLRDVTPTHSGRAARYVYLTLRASRISLCASLLAEVLALSDVLSAASLESALVPLTITFGVYSSIYVEPFLTYPYLTEPNFPNPQIT